MPNIDADLPDIYQLRPLHMAADNGDLKSVKALIKKGVQVKNKPQYFQFHFY